jgi:hypothetical protein
MKWASRDVAINRHNHGLGQIVELAPGMQRLVRLDCLSPCCRKVQDPISNDGMRLAESVEAIRSAQDGEWITLEIRMTPPMKSTRQSRDVGLSAAIAGSLARLKWARSQSRVASTNVSVVAAIRHQVEMRNVMLDHLAEIQFNLAAVVAANPLHVPVGYAPRRQNPFCQVRMPRTICAAPFVDKTEG